MFILSQDREKIVAGIGIIKIINYSWEENKNCFKLQFTTLEDVETLGEYKSKERAKEILLEIMKKAEVGNRVYYMPED